MDAQRFALEQLPMMMFLPPDLKKLVQDCFVPARFSFGGDIVQEGDETDGYYVLASGRARIVFSAFCRPSRHCSTVNLRNRPSLFERMKVALDRTRSSSAWIASGVKPVAMVQSRSTSREIAGVDRKWDSAVAGITVFRSPV